MLANIKYNPYTVLSNKQIYRNMRHDQVITCKSEPLYEEILDIIKLFPFRSTIHGTGHAFRVAIWCVVLYCQITQEKVETNEFIKYFLMGWLHDIGREHDDVDPEHGNKSESVIRGRHLDEQSDE